MSLKKIFFLCFFYCTHIRWLCLRRLLTILLIILRLLLFLHSAINYFTFNYFYKRTLSQHLIKIMEFFYSSKTEWKRYSTFCVPEDKGDDNLLSRGDKWKEMANRSAERYSLWGYNALITGNSFLSFVKRASALDFKFTTYSFRDSRITVLGKSCSAALCAILRGFSKYVRRGKEEKNGK